MKRRIPKYSLHKATGQARVRIDGRTIYLGKHGTPESFQRYEEHIAAWLTGSTPDLVNGLTIARLCVKYVTEHAKPYYRKHGRQTSELSTIQGALKPLIRLFGKTKVTDFGPQKLKRVQQEMVTAEIVRTSVNRNIGRIRRMFKWGVENELIPVNIHIALTAVSGLRHGRSEAKESTPVEPVQDCDIEAVHPYLSSQVSAMIEIQLATGMRPGEVRIMRTADIDSSGETWEYRPREHKTEHHGRKRVIFIGPKAQNIIRPFLKVDREQFLFSPAEAQQAFNDERRQNRQTPMTPSQKARQRKSSPQKTPGDCYSVTSYSRAIRNACEKADIPVWTPNRLRHNAATRLRKEYGIETVRTILGHATGFTTEIYAELDYEKARQVAATAG